MIAVSTALWVAAIVRFLRWRQHPGVNPAVGTIIVLTALAALTATNTRLFASLGVPTVVTSAAQQLLILAACVGAEVVVAGMATPHRLAHTLRLLVVASSVIGAVVLALFALGPAGPADLSIYQFAAQFAGDPYFGTAFLIVQLAAGIICARVAFHALRLTSNYRLRIPMILLALGATALTLYAILRSVFLGASIASDFEPHLVLMFNAMSYLAAVGALLLIVSFCWVPVSRIVRSIRHLHRQRAIYSQVLEVDSHLRADWRVGGLSLSRRADVRATVVLDFLTLLLPHPIPADHCAEPDAKRVAAWLALPATAARRPTVHIGLLAIPPGHRPAEWLDRILRLLPRGRAVLLDDLQEETVPEQHSKSTSDSAPVAKIVTEASAPWLVNTAAALYIGAVEEAIWWGVFAALIAGIGPILAILGLMRLGRASDHHVGNRSHRALVVAIIVAFMAAGVAAEVAGSAPQNVLTLSVAGLVTIVAVGLITSALKYKISVHTAVWAGTAVLVAALLSPWWLTALAALPVVAWARIRLQDHTLGQTVAGTALGIATVVLAMAALG